VIGMNKYLLRVNLANESLTEEEISREILEKYIGGKGFAAHYLYKELKPETDPLSPENKLVFFIGPLTGIFPAFSRHVIASKSPLTGTFSDSYAGGWFGAELAKTAYSGIIFEGRAEKPVYLKIDGETVSIEDAGDLIGKTPYEVDASFKDFRVSAIGSAGEKLVRFACVTNDAAKRERAGVAGRGGMGAVMGSKNLKAVVVRGYLKPDEIVPEKFRDKVNALLRVFMKYLKDEVKPGIGLGGNLPAMKLTGDAKVLPVRNFREGYIEDYEKVAEDAFRDLTISKNTCYLCPLACGVHIKIKTGSFAGLELDRIEYETVALNGPNCNQLDIGTITKVCLLCNEYGLDTMTMGNITAFVMECSEKGLIDYKLNYGDSEGQINLVKMVGERRNIGNILAEGLKRAAEEFGLKKYAVHIKGLEIPGYDVRGPVGMALAYATADRGGDHLRAWTIVDDLESPYSIEGRAGVTKKLQDRNSALWCLIGCDNIPANTTGDPGKFVDLSISALNTLGWKFDDEKFWEVGERVYTLTRLFNVREGFSRKDDMLPDRFMEPRADTGWKLTQGDFETMLNEYYSLRGWDEDGRPMQKTLERLEIDV
jgi:aldehyde:ferredoxin oxidoreductase